MATTHGRLGAVYVLEAGDSWEDLSDEACTESGAQAQITDAAKRFLNPNSPPTFTDSGGANVIRIDCVRGIAYFDANVAAVTVSGTDAYVPSASLAKAGYLYGWSLDVSIDLADKSVFQELWKTALPGLAQASGQAEGYFATDLWHAAFEDCADGTQPYFLLQLFSYDPDDDQSGDHWSMWASFTSWNVAAAVGAVVSEKIGFTVHGDVAFTANA